MRALRVIATLLVCAPLLAAFPAAHAQSAPAGQSQLSLTLDDPAMAFQPGSEGTLNLRGIYRISAGAFGQPDPEVVERGNGSRPTRVTFSVVTAPSWITNVTIDPPEAFVDPSAGYHVGGSYPFGPVAVRINVSPDAPALQREEIVIEGVAHPNGAIPEARAQSAAIKLRAAEVGMVNVTGPESPVLLSGGRWNVVTYTVTNLGNKETTVLLNVTVRPEKSEVEFPTEVQLARGESVDVEVRLRTPWTEREDGSLELEATPLLTDDVGPPTAYSVDVRGESAVPAPGAVPLAALAVALALLLRRRA